MLESLLPAGGAVVDGCETVGAGTPMEEAGHWSWPSSLIV